MLSFADRIVAWMNDEKNHRQYRFNRRGAQFDWRWGLDGAPALGPNHPGGLTFNPGIIF